MPFGIHIVRSVPYSDTITNLCSILVTEGLSGSLRPAALSVVHNYIFLLSLKLSPNVLLQCAFSRVSNNNYNNRVLIAHSCLSVASTPDSGVGQSKNRSGTRLYIALQLRKCITEVNVCPVPDSSWLLSALSNRVVEPHKVQCSRDNRVIMMLQEEAFFFL